jgi:magnesium transporter
MIPQREVLNKLARGDFPQVDNESRAFFRDVYDHLVRMNDIIESVRDLVIGAMDTYLSVINNRMSEAMKTLTLITTFFMPIAFIAAFFGMNFFLPRPEETAWINTPILLLALALMLLAPVGMYWWIKRRGWL